MTRITRSYIAPNPKEFEYWVDLQADPKGNVIKYYAGSGKWKPLNDDKDNDQSAKIAELEANKVDKVPGKQLSTNDFSTALMNKLVKIPDNANHVDVNNTLTSTSATAALSAAQGKTLKDLIDSLTARVAALETPVA